MKKLLKKLLANRFEERVFSIMVSLGFAPRLFNFYMWLFPPNWEVRQFVNELPSNLTKIRRPLKIRLGPPVESSNVY